MKREFLMGFIILISLFTITSSKTIFHDTPEYINMAKSLAGYGNYKSYSTHSFLHSFIISLFLKIIPSLTIIKLVNMSWLILIALLLYYFIKDQKTFLIFIFSPIVWILSVQITPILPSAFLLLLMYLSFKKYEINGKKLLLIISGLSAGLAFAMYTPNILPLFFFIIAFFFNRNVKELILFLSFLIIGLAPQILLDIYYTGIPFYSFIRYFGTNLIVFLGLNQGTSPIQGLINKEYLWLLILISPLLFFIYRLRFNIYKKELFFLIPPILFFIIRGGLMKYFFPIIPIIIFLLSKVLSKRLILIHILLSLILIPIFTYSYFTFNEQKLIKMDFKKIQQEYNFPKIITEVDVMISQWENYPQLVLLEEYQFERNKDYSKEYKLESNPRFKADKILELKASLKRDKSDEPYDNLPLVLRKIRKKQPEGYKLIKCYQILCLYELPQYNLA